MPTCGRRRPFPFVCFGAPRLPIMILIGFVLGCVLSLVTFPFFHLLSECSTEIQTAPFRQDQVVELPVKAAMDKRLPQPAVMSAEPESVYEPVLVKPEIVPNYTNKKNRPRFIATELGIRDKLLVAVVTSRDTAQSLAIALNRTSDRYVSKMLFFINCEATDLLNAQHLSLNIVGIPTSSLPTPDPLFALSYVAKHFSRAFDWFLLYPDYTYVVPLKIIQFVSAMSIAEDVVIGQPLKDDADVCSYDAGILLSRGALKRMEAGLSSCIARKKKESSADVYQVGHCVRDLTKMKCKTELKGQKFVSWELPPILSIENELNWLMKQEDFNRSISIFKVTSSADIYHLHKHFCEVEVTQINDKIGAIRRETVRQAALLNLTLSKPIGDREPWRTTNHYELLLWDSFTESELFEVTNPRNVRPMGGVHAKDVNNLLETCKARMATESPDLRFKHMLSGYRKFDPTRGIDYILDLVFSDSDGNDVSTRFSLLRPLNKVELVPVPYIVEASSLWLILPVTVHEVEATKRFLASYNQLFMAAAKGLTVLLLVQEERLQSDWFLPLVHEIERLELYQRPERVVTFHVLRNELRSPLLAMDYLVRTNPDLQLCLVLSPWVILTREFLNRVRINAIQNFQVFFPIPFVFYHPFVLSSFDIAVSRHTINGRSGHFDDLDFSVAAFYRSDYVRHRNRAEDPSNNENVQSKPDETAYGRFDLVDLFLNTDLHVMRAIDPALVVEYHDKLCDGRWHEHLFNRCEMSQKESIGSKDQLAGLVLNETIQDVN